MAIGLYDIVFLLLFICIAFLPTYISFKRAHTNKLWVFLLSWAGYWTYGITWIMALAWAVVGETDSEKPSLQSLKPFSEKPLGAHTVDKFKQADGESAQERKSAEAKSSEKDRGQLEAQEENNKSIETRISRVKSMSEDGLITENQAADKIDQILNEL